MSRLSICGTTTASNRGELHAPGGLWTGSLALEMTIGLKGENLLDDDVRNHVSFKKDEGL
jgi:hypothetical protein